MRSVCTRSNPEDQKLRLLRKLPIGICITRGLDFVSVTAWGCACMLGSNLLTVSKAEGKRPHKAPLYRRCNLTPKRNLEKAPTTVLINTALTNICWSRFKFMMYCIFTIDLCAPTYHISQETTQFSTKAMSCQPGRIIINEILYMKAIYSIVRTQETKAQDIKLQLLITLSGYQKTGILIWRFSTVILE